MKKHLYSFLKLFIPIFLGIGTGFSNQKILMIAAESVSTIFLNFLSMIAAPVILLAIISTLINMKGLEQLKHLGKKVITYTLITTVLAALTALGFFLLLDPVAMVQKSSEIAFKTEQHSYLHFFVEIIPSNIFTAFAENKVISIAFLGFLLGITAHFLSEDHRKTLQKGFSALFQLFLKIASIITYVIPVAIWAFMALLVQNLQNPSGTSNGIWTYLIVIVVANLTQGLVVIPLLLKMRGLSPWKIAKGSSKALLTAFFTKSSNATLPISLKVAKEELGLRPEVANFTLPLCTVINMNGCAAFILTTILFVAGVNGHVFSALDLAFWVVMSVLAAVGNAGVPMGCFFLSSAFLISIGVPLTTMGLILPFYALIDMEETALNVWSDLSVASIIDKECKATNELQALDV